MKLATIDFGSLESIASPKIAGSSPSYVISRLVPYIFFLAGFILLLYLIIGGYQYMTSGGDPKATASARQIITNAIAGFIIIFLAYWIVQIIARVLNLAPILNMFG